MDRSTITDWARSAWAYVRDHWQEHLVPGAVLAGGIFVLSLLIYIGMVAFVASLFLAERSALWPVLGGLVGFLLFVLGNELIQPLLLGYTRGTLRSMRGEGFPVGELWEGYRRSLSVVLLTLAQSTLALLGMLLCYVPGLVVSLFTSLALVALADRDQGPMDALRTSYELVRARPLDMALWFLAMLAAVLAASMVPMVGAVAALPVMTVMNVTAYLFLSKEAGARPARAP